MPDTAPEQVEGSQHDYIVVHESDLLKLRSALGGAAAYLTAVNDMNAALHRDEVVYSPLTVIVQQAAGRVTALLEGVNSKRQPHQEDEPS